MLGPAASAVKPTEWPWEGITIERMAAIRALTLAVAAETLTRAEMAGESSVAAIATTRPRSESDSAGNSACAIGNGFEFSRLRNDYGYHEDPPHQIRD